MSASDPIAEMLTRIRNAARARHAEVEMGYSRLRESCARVLVAEGFLEPVEVKGEGYRRTLLLRLRYGEAREPVLKGLRRVSRPGLRRYAGAKTMPRVQGGIGLNIVSTPLGVMTDREARQRNVGGEVLFGVW